MLSTHHSKHSYYLQNKSQHIHSLRHQHPNDHFSSFCQTLAWVHVKCLPAHPKRLTRPQKKKPMNNNNIKSPSHEEYILALYTFSFNPSNLTQIKRKNPDTDIVYQKMSRIYFPLLVFFQPYCFQILLYSFYTFKI